MRGGKSSRGRTWGFGAAEVGQSPWGPSPGAASPGDPSRSSKPELGRSPPGPSGLIPSSGSLPGPAGFQQFPLPSSPAAPNPWKTHPEPPWPGGTDPSGFPGKTLIPGPAGQSRPRLPAGARSIPEMRLQELLTPKRPQNCPKPSPKLPQTRPKLVPNPSQTCPEPVMNGITMSPKTGASVIWGLSPWRVISGFKSSDGRGGSWHPTNPQILGIWKRKSHPNKPELSQPGGSNSQLRP